MTRPAADDVRLPDGTRLLHVGPHKTGTTSIQSAFHLARRAARAHGVRYAGPSRHPVGAVQAVVASGTPEGRAERPIRPWRRLVDEIRGAREPIVVLSSEWFADADPSVVRRVVDDLGGELVHVVVTLRPLARLLPSQWQQYVQAGLAIPYEPWLEAVLADPDASTTPSFWYRHRHDELIARWAEVVGRDQVTAVVVDDRDHGRAMRAFEALTGLPPGTLVPEDARVNRSLTAPEIELVRRLNLRLAPERLPTWLQLNLVLYGAAAALRSRTPAPGEPRLETPTWAQERAAELGRQVVAGIGRTGVRVLGDLSTLSESRTGGAPRNGAEAAAWAPDDAWPDLIAAAAVGVLTATGLGRSLRVPEAHRAALELVPTVRLAGVVAGRLRSIASARPWQARHAGRAASGAGAERRRSTRDGSALGPSETAILAACLDAFRAAGAGGRLRAHLGRSIAAELEDATTHPRSAGDDATSPGAGDRWAELGDRWAELGAAAAVAVARASGLLAGGGRRLAPPRARGETLEVAAIATAGLAAIVAGRVFRAAAVRDRSEPAEPGTA